MLYHYCCLNCDFNHNYLYHYYFKEKTRNIMTLELKITLLNLFINTKVNEMNPNKLFWSNFFLFSIFFPFSFSLVEGEFWKIYKGYHKPCVQLWTNVSIKNTFYHNFMFHKEAFLKKCIFLCNLVEYPWIYICS